MCVLPSPSASLGCFALPAQPSGFLLSLVSKVKVALRSESFSLAEGVGKLCICSRTVCLVLCSVVYFDINQILLCCLKSGAVGFVACAWHSFLVQQLSSWTVSSTPGMCVLPSPSANLGFFALLLSLSGFLLSLVSNVKLLVRGALESFSLAEGVGKLCICSRTVCLVLGYVMYFDINQNLLCCLGIRISWLRRLCLAGSLPVFPGAAVVFLDVSSTPGMCVLPSPSASLGCFALPTQPEWLFAYSGV